LPNRDFRFNNKFTAGSTEELARGLKKSLYFGFYNFQIFFKKGEAKLTANYRRKPLKSL
jgi:hypothetical protein